MKIKFIKACGHHPKGEVLPCENGPGNQYIVGGFAELYVKPKAEQKPKPKKKVAKPKSKE